MRITRQSVEQDVEISPRTRFALFNARRLLGFSRDEIRRVIADKCAGQSPCAEVRGIVRRRLDELDERMKEMRRYRRELAAALAVWDNIPIAAGLLYPFTEWLLSPVIANAAMSLSSVSVVTNSLRLRRFHSAM